METVIWVQQGRWGLDNAWRWNDEAHALRATDFDFVCGRPVSGYATINDSREAAADIDHCPSCAELLQRDQDIARDERLASGE